MGGVNPTDMQVMVTNSVDVAKKYSDESYKGIAGQQNLAKEDKKVTEETTKKIYDKNFSQKIYKDEEDNNEREEGSQEREENEEEDDNLTDDVVENYHVYDHNGHFDVKV